MKKISLLTTFVFAALLTAAPLTEEKQLSKLPLMKWNCAVASAAKSSMKTPAGGATVECTYPIIFDESGKPKGTSWPRCNMRIPAAVQNWSGYDYLEFCVYTTFNRSDEEYLPLTLGISTAKKRGAFSYNITTLSQNQWVKVSVPLRSLKKNGAIKSIQFHLNARRYFPNDKLVLNLGDFKLVRLLEWQVKSFKMTAPAIFADRVTLPVEYELLGPGEKAQVPFALFNSKGQKIKDISLASERGFGYYLLPVGKLAPGKYTLAVFPGDKQRRHETIFQVVAPPWK